MNLSELRDALDDIERSETPWPSTYDMIAALDEIEYDTLYVDMVLNAYRRWVAKLEYTGHRYPKTKKGWKNTIQNQFGNLYITLTVTQIRRYISNRYIPMYLRGHLQDIAAGKYGLKNEYRIRISIDALRIYNILVNKGYVYETTTRRAHIGRKNFREDGKESSTVSNIALIDKNSESDSDSDDSDEERQFNRGKRHCGSSFRKGKQLPVPEGIFDFEELQ